MYLWVRERYITPTREDLKCMRRGPSLQPACCTPKWPMQKRWDPHRLTHNAALKYTSAAGAAVGGLLGPDRCRLVKEDFELHGKRIKKGSTVLASMLYAKATDPRVSAGDHVKASVPLHMDIHQLQASVKPERWLDPTNKLDMGVSASAENPQDGVTRFVLSTQPCTNTCIPPSLWPSQASRTAVPSDKR